MWLARLPRLTNPTTPKGRGTSHNPLLSSKDLNFQSRTYRSDPRGSQHSSSPPPARRRRSISPPPRHRPSQNAPIVPDVDPIRRRERERQIALRQAENELDKERGGENPKAKDPEFDAEAEFKKLISSKSGGVYMPPARLRALQAAAAEDKASPEYQRLSWDALRKSLTGIVNRVNVTNIKNVVPELFSENLIRGRGLLARSIMKAQASSLPFTPVFAAVISVINTKLPQVGELLLARLVSQFRRSLKRRDKVRHSSILPHRDAKLMKLETDRMRVLFYVHLSSGKPRRRT